MKMVPRQNRSRAFTDNEIDNQFQGMEVESDDKATLFPVQVDKQHPRSRNRSHNGSRNKVRQLWS
jgi:hypothetical protein